MKPLAAPGDRRQHQPADSCSIVTPVLVAWPGRELMGSSKATKSHSEVRALPER